MAATWIPRPTQRYCVQIWRRCTPCVRSDPVRMPLAPAPQPPIGWCAGLPSSAKNKSSFFFFGAPRLLSQLLTLNPSRV
eukprot:3664015-Prymnesium_polylepis.1